MKTLCKLCMGLVFLFLLIYTFSCSGEGTTESLGKEVQFVAYQVGNCNHNSLGKISANDSCFAYSFGETLKVDLCVSGNCCPDSNRFVTDYKISSDTLFVTVSDTAARLCRCMCNYTIHMEISGLQNNEYVFYCNHDNIIVYNEQIRK